MDLKEIALNAVARKLETVVDPDLLRRSMTDRATEQEVRRMYESIPYPPRLWNDIVTRYYEIGLFVSLDDSDYRKAVVHIQQKDRRSAIHFVSDGEYFLDKIVVGGRAYESENIVIDRSVGLTFRAGGDVLLTDYNGKISKALELLDYDDM